MLILSLALYGSRYLEALINDKQPLIRMSPSKTLDDLYAAGLIHPTREHSRQATLPSDKDSQAIADTIAAKTTTQREDVMLLKRWNGKLLAEKFGLPGMELEIERAVEQVQEAIKARSNLTGEEGIAENVPTGKSPSDSEKR